MAAIQFVVFEPEDWLPGNAEFKVVADRMIPVLAAQVRRLRQKEGPRLIPGG
jgi:hypothetical protein